MNIGIVGSSGYLGRFLIDKLKKDKKITVQAAIGRKGDNDSRYLFLDLLKPERFDYGKLESLDAVLFLAAVSSPDICAKEFESSYAANVTGSIYFIKEALKKQCRVLFFSSDAVFGQDLGRAFDEESPANPNTPYGIMKKEVEDAFMGQENFKVIRLPYVVSKEDRFTTYILSCIKKQVTAEIYHPFYRNAVGRETVGQAVLWMLFHWESFSSGILHVSGSELVSRIRIADEISRFLGQKLSCKILRPSNEFYQNRQEITQIKSIYNRSCQIWKEVSFTEQIQKELEGWKIE